MLTPLYKVATGGALASIVAVVGLLGANLFQHGREWAARREAGS
jgi:hypothetical protein